MAGTIRIGTHEIGDHTQCYVIAEIGHNHQGSLEKAKELFREAKAAGAHAAKLQKRDNRGLYTRAAYNKPYDNENSFGATYGEHREFLEFGAAEYRALGAYAKELGIDFFATAFDLTSAEFLAGLDMPAFKIASGDIKSIPLLKHVAGYYEEQANYMTKNLTTLLEPMLIFVIGGFVVLLALGVFLPMWNMTNVMK